MTQRRDRFWGWPEWAHLRYFAFLAIAQMLWFGVIYGGSDLLTARRTLRLRVHLDLEERIPFVPAAVSIYMSIYILFWIAPLILRIRRELRALMVTHAVVTACAGICFLLFPAETDFPIPRDLGVSADLFRFADWLNLDYNQVPSLHVALGTACVAVFADRAGRSGRIFLWSWAVGVCVSAVLTYQHHILDVLTGFLLGIIAVRIVYRRLTASDEPAIEDLRPTARCAQR